MQNTHSILAENPTDIFRYELLCLDGKITLKYIIKYSARRCGVYSSASGSEFISELL